jgi:hypothetical protein
VELKASLGVVDGRGNLSSVPHDAGVPKESLDVSVAEPGDSGNVEAGECRTKGFTFTQDGQPRQPRLKPFKANLLEQSCVIVNRATPLLVVVSPVLLWRPTPEAAQDAVITSVEDITTYQLFGHAVSSAHRSW